MDWVTGKQTIINQRREIAVNGYPLMWGQMISAWKRPDEANRAWLIYAANYLFHTAQVRWALDPLTMKQRVPEAAEMDLVHDLEGLSFVLLTHRHKDHMDLNLIHQLSGLPIQWVVPDDLLELVEQAGLSRQKIILPRSMESLEIEGHKITPFDGLHWQTDPGKPEGRRGVPATGYLVEFKGKRWLFPGDVRTYDIDQVPSFGPLDGTFIHLWLGRGRALLPEPPLLETFCRFCRNLNSRRIILAHLNEYGREAGELWDESHVQLIQSWLKENDADIIVETAIMGQCVEL
jgi:hypothetical protein